MFRVYCLIVFIFCSGLFRATDMLVPDDDDPTVFVPLELDTYSRHIDERHRADILRSVVAEKMKKARKQNELAQQKIQRLYEVERKEKHLVKLLMANKEHRADALKLQNNLLLAVLWFVLLVVSISVIVLYRRRIEREKSSLLMHRAAFTARENEKFRFSRELHDDFQATLSIMHMMAVHEHDKSPENQHLAELKRTSKNAIHEIRKISDVLYPREINTEGWLASLNALIRRTNEKSTDLAFCLTTDVQECDKDLQLPIYRSVEELIQNALLSSSAKEVVVSLRKLNKGFELHYSESGLSENQKKRDLQALQVSIQRLGGKLVVKRPFLNKCEFKVFFFSG